IEELDAFLTKTSLRRLPLWALGTNDVLEDIADQLNDGSAMVAYEQGLRALAIRNYPAAARYLAAAEQRGLRLPATTPLRAYALCLADQCDTARALIPAAPSDAGERHFWEWFGRRFELAPTVSR